MSESVSERLPAALPSAPQAPEQYEPIHPGSGRQGLRKRLASALAALALLLAKAKSLLFLLPKLKLLTTFGSMLVSVAAYALLFGFPFAVGFVALLFLHEIGHVIQLRREGIKASAPMFIPFLGAVISAKSMGKDAAAEARVGLAGPVLGSIASLVPLAVWLATGSDFWRALAYIGFLLNLFNLLPVVPLDGGRAMAALSPAIWLAGLGGARRSDGLLPEPDPVPDPDLRRTRELASMEGSRDASGRAYYAIPARTRALVGRYLRRPRGPARSRSGRDLLLAQPLIDLEQAGEVLLGVSSAESGTR